MCAFHGQAIGVLVYEQPATLKGTQCPQEWVPEQTNLQATLLLHFEVQNQKSWRPGKVLAGAMLAEKVLQLHISSSSAVVFKRNAKDK